MRRLLPARLLAALQPQATERYEPPADVLRASRHRVRIAALLGTAGYALFFVLQLSGLIAMSDLERRIDVVQNGISLVLCLALLAVTARATVADRWVLTSALVVEMLLTALISIADPWASFLHTCLLYTSDAADE